MNTKMIRLKQQRVNFHSLNTHPHKNLYLWQQAQMRRRSAERDQLTRRLNGSVTADQSDHAKPNANLANLGR